MGVEDASDVIVARRTAVEMALAIGFDSLRSQEIGIVTSELATNLLKHAGKGSIRLSRLKRGDQAGIEVASMDRGPGPVLAEDALADGFSTAGSLGYGLGTVHRLMDELRVDPMPDRGGGTCVRGIRWVWDRPKVPERSPLDVGAASRPHPALEINGDAFVIQKWPGGLLVAVIDGLGHGQFAHRAAQKARCFVESHARQPLEEIFRGVHRECRTTRGVVMALARFEFDPPDPGGGTGSFPAMTVRHGNIGNIETRVSGNREPFNISLRRGILGKNAPNLLATAHAWGPQCLMVMHSDGLSSHWSWNDVQISDVEPATVIAQRLLRRLARDSDDATVVVIKKR